MRTLKENRVFADSRWLFTADADELLILQRHSSVDDLLAELEDSEQIIIAWDLFVPDPESSRFDGDFDMRSRFTSVIDDFSFIKSFSRVDRFPENIAPHRIIGKSSRTTLADGAEIDPAELKTANGRREFNPRIEAMLSESKHAASLYHYRFKSAVEFCMRQARGVAGPYTLKNNGMLFVNTMRSNPGAARRINPAAGAPEIDAVAAQAEQLRALPRVAEIEDEVNQAYLAMAAEIERNSLTYRFIMGYLENPQQFVASDNALALLEENPSSSEMLWLTAFCFRHEKNYQRAFEISAQAIAQTPAHSQHHRRFVANMEKRAAAEQQQSAQSGVFGKLLRRK